MDQSIAVDRLTFDKSAAKEEMEFKRWALSQDHTQKLKEAKEDSKRRILLVHIQHQQVNIEA